MKQKGFKKETDIDHRLIDLRRVARVVAGGRRFSFRATVVAGTRKGRVGIGVAKGKDTAFAIEKALRRAKASSIIIPINTKKSIMHEVSAKYGSSYVIIKPGRSGRGLVAGGSVRSVLELAGIENASAKILSRSSNKLNNALAAVEALKKLKSGAHSVSAEPISDEKQETISSYAAT